MTTSYEVYLAQGCGRCPLGGTPACKVLRWTSEIELLRSIVLGEGLVETVKWGVPTYTFEGKNAVMISALKDACVLAFPQGALIPDPSGLLEFAGPNSRVARQTKFTHTDAIAAARPHIVSWIAAAKQLILNPPPRATDALSAPALPPALLAAFASHAGLRDAFESLTPGRQRSHILHISGAAQTATQERRTAACIPVILAGRGWLER
jgi:uncharacterized protein YdeI (YjbR/CyaY-like superfamily)